ncbi:MAG: ATP-binding protein [Pseudomonadota bacterium]
MTDGPQLAKIAEKLRTPKEPKKPLPRLVGVHSVLKNKYKIIGLTEEWVKFIGQPEENFKMIVYGKSGSGKTTFVMLLCKALAMLGKVYYNSSEEGEGKSIQDAFIRCDMGSLEKSSFMLGDRHTFSEMLQIIGMKRGPRIVVIDSLQYMKLTKDQYKILIESFPKKAFIIISWSKGDVPEGVHAQGIEYMVDIKTYVKDGVAVSRSRFGATEPFQIYPPKKTMPGPQEPPFETKPKGKAKKAAGTAEISFTDTARLHDSAPEPAD